MAKKRGDAKTKNKPNSPKENEPGPVEDTKHTSKGIKREPAEDTKKGSTKGIKREPAEDTKKGSTEDIKRGPAENSKQGSTKDIKREAAENSKQGSTKDIKREPAEDSKQGSAEGIKRGPAEETKQESTEGIKRGPAEKHKQEDAENIQHGSKEDTKHGEKGIKGAKKGNKPGSAKGKGKPGKGSKGEPSEESEQGSAEAKNHDSTNENDVSEEEDSRPAFVKKIEHVCEKALEIFVDYAIVEVLFQLEKLYKLFRKCLRSINLITFFLFKSVLQCYTAVHFMHMLMDLLVFTGMHFEFPLKDANHFIINMIKYLTWDFKLFCLIVTTISFINDLINTGHHGRNHVDGIWIVLLAEVEMIVIAPLRDHLNDHLLLTLVTITVARLMVEIFYKDSDDLNSSVQFFSLFVFIQLGFLILCAFLIFLYEASKFLEEYVPDVIVADVIF